MLDILSSGKGVRLGLVVEGEGRAHGTCVCGNLSTTTHPLQYQSFKLDMQEAAQLKCVCPRSVSFFGKRSVPRTCC
jgi:hypothetical protein